MTTPLDNVTTLKDKIKILDDIKNHTKNLDLQAIYKHIHNIGQDSHELLEHALKINFGNVLRNQGSNDQTEALQVFKKVCETARDLNHICIYVKLIKNNSRQDLQKVYLKELGFQTEKLITEFRKQGTIIQQLRLDTNDITKQRFMIEMITTLCPQDLGFNPELFSLMLIPFKCLHKADPTDISLLERLADVLLSQCNGQGIANQNQVHDWLALLTGIIQYAYEGNSIGLFILLRKIPDQHISELLYRHKYYMLLNYFNNLKVALKIFQGLTFYSITQQSIFFIKTISQFLYEYALEIRSKQYSDILKYIYQEFILTTMLGNIQMVNYSAELIDLLLFYIVGMSSIDQDPFLKSLDLLYARLKQASTFKIFNKEFATQRIQFLLTVAIYYNGLNTDEQYLNVIKIYQITNQLNPHNQYTQWNFSKLIEQQNQIDQNILLRDSKDFVGLENLTNTCFMNSILAKLIHDLVLQKVYQSLQLIPYPSKLSSLQKLFLLLTYQKQGYCSPYELKRQLREPYSNTNDQQDVSEFAHHFLEDLLELLPKHLQIPMEKIFFGYHRSCIECFNCPKRQPAYRPKEKFLGIDLHFNEDEDNQDLYDMIRKAYEKEQIEFTCDKCNQRTDRVFKSQQLIQLPSVLFMIVHRFTFNAATQTMNKMLTKVPFRFQIDFRDIFNQKKLNSKDCIYDLYAFIVHMGKNSYSGHYICYARQLNKPDVWVTFDDTMISNLEYDSDQLDKELIAEETPYLLFYQNQSGQPLIFNN
ncbi:unnamed protein product (macronuclear) [Paramecium tetraurelia]|uniref:USP domain-containing protein n=1 Tax=Paramecium tetraurelia TaxID=5888 RepID=A0DI82_PARTE|nr:uncharacterized protein GSPATT00017120001 [Paramecium tetraurelia]CAK82749.1 unnamed protein product [Paramecium tetraurelia]|eukprot:XP_001450146.1 hypothetical protein (macronuclear) [Paramecium tetraurelia strain d4-2]